MSHDLNSFAAFILTHGRPNSVFTLDSLRKHGYSGKVFLIIDNLDPHKDDYLRKFKDQVIIFDKEKVFKSFDCMDNFKSLNGVIAARNVCFKIAKDLRLKHFIQLDDDYTYFSWRFNDNLDYLNHTPACKSLDRIFLAMINFLENTPIKSIALAQGGDFVGGKLNQNAEKVFLKRKVMNSFICSVDRPFQFIGRINEDVNLYAFYGSLGDIFFQTNFVSLKQKQTQTNANGMTILYLEYGTYIKSFYSVMLMPSSVSIKMLNSKNARLHHSVFWNNTVPMILKENLKKSLKKDN